MSFDKYYPFTAAELPFELNALDPNISEYTLYFHHDKHYMNYINKLNKLLEDRPLMQNIPLEALTKVEDEAIRTNAGGVYNHELYFSSLTPNYRPPSGEMANAIEKCFGSLKELEEKLAEKCMDVIGSGWVWLAMDLNGKLCILVTHNQDAIDFDKYTPLLIIDVWEHAYYLDRQNRRDKYLCALNGVLNWHNANMNMEN